MVYISNPGKGGIDGARRLKKALTGFIAPDEWIEMFDEPEGKEARSADCAREPDGKFGDGNKCQVTDGVLKPGTAEPHDSEPSFKDEDDDHVYHVTTADNAESILSGGFKQSPHTVKGGSYESYSKGKVFFTEKSGLATWKSKIEDHLFHSHDDPPPVAIVKVKKSEVEHLLKPDTIGSKDAGAKSYYVDLSGRKKEGRGFCPTGEGGGVDNSCGGAKVMMAPDKDSGGGSSKPLPSYANDIEHTMPKSKGFDDPKNSQAWLSPTGAFFPVSGDHGEYARHHGVEGGGDELLDAGWVRVAGHSGDTLFVGNPSGFVPKGRQLSSLKDFAISTGRLKRIVFDNGKSRDGRVLWQSDERSLDARHAGLLAFAQSRGFCPTGEGGGVDNSCGGKGGAKVLMAPDTGSGGGSSTPSPYKHFPSEQEALTAAVGRWKGQTTDLGIHVQDEIDGAPQPSSGSGGKLREMAAALLKEVKENSRPAPTLYRGDDKTTAANSSVLVGWTSNRRVAEKWAKKYGGEVQTLEGASGVKLADIVGKTRDMGEDEWIVLNAPRKQKRSLEHRDDDCGRDEGGRFGDGNKCQRPTIGININDSNQDFTVQILAGEKTTETRITDSLAPYVGKTVGIVRTGKGKATLVGTMKVGKPKFYKTAKEFDADFDKHKIGPDSPHYIGPEGKYGYPLSEVKPVKPVRLDSKGIVARVIHASSRCVTVEYHLGAERRDAGCNRDPNGRFGEDNNCQKEGSGSNALGEYVPPISPEWGMKEKPWGESGEKVEVYTPDDPLFSGAESVSEITVRTQGLKEALAATGVSLPAAIRAAGIRPGSLAEAGVGELSVRVEALKVRGRDSVLVQWTAANTDARDVNKYAVEAVRYISKNDKGELEITADSFFIHPRFQGRGIALEMMRGMVNSGARRIRMPAAGRRDGAGVLEDEIMTGYCDWPKYGYDCPIAHALSVSRRRTLPPQFSEARTLLDVYSLPGGREWWRKDGDGVTLEFDCTPGSKSLRVFYAYEDATKRKLSRRSKARDDKPIVGLDCDYDPLLDEVWDEIVEAGGIGGERSLSERRDADCTRTPDGKFGSGNKCQEEGDGAAAVSEPKSGGWGENEKEWGASGGDTEVYKPQDKLFDGAELISTITLRTDGLKEALKATGVSLPKAIAASGLNPAAMKQAGVGDIHVSISSDDVGSVYVMWQARKESPDRRNAVEARRNIVRNEQGDLEIIAQSFSISSDYQGRGIAREMMRSMISSGASQIVMHQAAAGLGMSGYFQWPKYGYNASAGWVARISQDQAIPPQFSEAKTLLGIYALPGGREWWKEKGSDIALVFDCTPGSESMRVFAAYDEATNRKLANRSAASDGSDGPIGTDCDFDPTLDEVWDEIVKSGGFRVEQSRSVVVHRRDAACTRTPDGKFGDGNKCQEEGDGWGKDEKEWGRSGGMYETYTSDEPLFRGAEAIKEIQIDPDGLRDALDGLGVSLPHVIKASGLDTRSLESAGIGNVTVSVRAIAGRVSVSWKAFPLSGGTEPAAYATRSVVGNSERFDLRAEEFYIREDFRGKGIALEMMRGMVASGARSIVMKDAARFDPDEDMGYGKEDRLTGYCEWPKYGYDCDVAEVKKSARNNSIPPQFAEARTLLDIYALPGGREWWKENGGSISLRFDCTPGSKSMRVFRAYEKTAKRKASNRSEPRGGVSAVGVDCDFDPTLDEVWDEIVENGGLRAERSRSTTARHAALLAFAQSRDADCTRTPDGKFGSGNKCQEEGDGADSSQTKVSPVPTPPRADYIELGTGELSSEEYLHGLFKGGYASDVDHFRYQSAVAKQVGEAGVDFEVDTHVRDGRRTVDSVRAVSVGVQFAIDAGIRLPERVLIANTSRYVGSPAFACAIHEPHSPVPTIAIDRSLSASEVSDRIRANWLGGDPARPLESLFVHELSHLDHYDSLPPSSQVLWEKWTGLPQLIAAKRDAELSGKVWRPSAEALGEFAWDRSLRVSDLSGLSESQAIEVARKHVSEYAAKNPLEFVAEFRTGVVMGKSYPDEAWNLYDDYGGPKIPKAKDK